MPGGQRAGDLPFKLRRISQKRSGYRCPERTYVPGAADVVSHIVNDNGNHRTVSEIRRLGINFYVHVPDFAAVVMNNTGFSLINDIYRKIFFIMGVIFFAFLNGYRRSLRKLLQQTGFHRLLGERNAAFNFIGN